MGHARDMPIEPPDPLALAKLLRDLRDQTDAVRLRIADLVTAKPDVPAYRDAYSHASAAKASLNVAANDLDPPA